MSNFTSIQDKSRDVKLQLKLIVLLIGELSKALHFCLYGKQLSLCGGLL